jgi:hypothetical protein
MVDSQEDGLIRILPGHKVFNQPPTCYGRESYAFSRAATGLNAAGTEVRCK